MKAHPLPHPRAPAADPILEARHLTKRFGGATAIDGVCLSIAAGEVAGLIGPNGAGKSTLFDILAGDQRPTGGRVLLGGRDVQREPAHTRLQAGLGRTFQIPRPFTAMSVVENVMLGSQNPPGERPWANWLWPARVARSERALLNRAMELLDFVALAPLAQDPAGNLSGGQRKLLELARLLMAAPAVVLLDEPAAGVNPELLELIVGKIAELNRGGTTFLIVEHDMALVGRLCSRVFVMTSGRLLRDGDPAEVLRDPRVVEAYLGGGA
jgi:branched-chain amino acid transport system ATP-binding protein